MLCKKCGKNISKNSKFCKYCGTKLEFIPTAKNVEDKVKNKGLVIIEILLLIVFFLASIDFKLISDFLFKIYKFLHLPFEVFYVDKIRISLPSFFIYNFIITLIMAILLIKQVSENSFNIDENLIKRDIDNFKTSSKKKTKTRFPVGMVILVSVLFLFLYILVIIKQFFLLQDILFILCFIIIGKYFYKLEKVNLLKDLTTNIIPSKEFVYLLFFTFVALIIYVFDWRSWKYIYIGDEYTFYYFAKDIADGKVPLRMLYENGIYEHHPVWASLYQGIFMLLFGKHYIGWRLSSTIIPVLGIIPLYLWIRIIFNRNIAILAIASYTFALPLMAFARIPHDIIHAIFPFIMGMFLLEIAIRRNSYFITFLAAIFAGLCFYTFQTARLIVPVGFFYWLFHPLRKEFSVKKVMAGVIIFIAFVLPIILGGINTDNPTGSFIDKMLIHTFVKAKEVRPVDNDFAYMITNFIHAFFSFMVKYNISHYVTHPISDLITAIGVILGFAFLIVYFKKDWRARFLLFSFLANIFIIGSICQYAYPPNTRLNFLVIIYSIIGAIGLYSLISLLQNIFNLKNKKVNLIFSFAFIIILLNLYIFFVLMPLKANYNPEAIAMKFVEENKKRKTIVVSEILHDLPSIMKNHFYNENTFEKISLEEFKKRLLEDKLKGNNILFCYDIVRKYADLSDIITKGEIIYPRDNMRFYYLFDFAKDDIYLTFKQAMSDKIGKEEILKIAESLKKDSENINIKEQAVSGVKKKIEFPKIKFKFDLSKIQIGFCKKTPKNIFLNENVYAQILNLDGELKMAIDIAVTKNGDNIFIADARDNSIKIYNKKGDLIYRFKKSIHLHKRFAEKIKEGLIYITLDDEDKKLFVVDCIYGTLDEYDMDGNYKKTLVSNGYLMGTRSLRYFRFNEQELIVTSVPPNSGFIIYNTMGQIVKSLLDRPGKKCDEFDQPCFVTLDSKQNIYLYDTGNAAIKVLNQDFKLQKAIAIDGASTIMGPQFIIDENKQIPYLVATIQNSNSLKIYSLDWKKCLIVRFGENGLPRFIMPTAIAQDLMGDLYIISPQENKVIKVKLPQLFK